MKKYMLITCGILIAFFKGATAQLVEKEIKDSLTLTVENNNKVILIRSGQEKFHFNDSLKNRFIDDVQKAWSDSLLNDQPRLIHYMFHPSQKSKLWIESDAFTNTPLNPEHEYHKMTLNLNKLEIRVHGLANTEVHFFLNSIEDLLNLRNYNLNEAIEIAAKNKREVRRFTMNEYYRTSSIWQYKEGKQKSNDAIELGTGFGISLLGNQLSPFISLDASLRLVNKYYATQHRFGASYITHVVTEFSAGRYTGVFSQSFVDFKYVIKPAGFKKGMGIVYGFPVGSGTPASEIQGMGQKFGLILSEGPHNISYSFEYIKNKGTQGIPVVTIRLPLGF